VPRQVADEVAAAVASALDNVDKHAGPGARAWVLLEDDADGLTVSVRDDGAGFAPERLDEAAAAGRLGVAQSIRGRIRDLGGSVEITAAPGQGTEVEIRLGHPAATKAR
jgi:signal transduction histidine kinase